MQTATEIRKKLGINAQGDIMACQAAEHKGPMECLVGKCVNNEDQGNGLYLHVTDKKFGKMGVEWVCMPCWDAFTDKSSYPQYSQVFRNMKDRFFSQQPLDVEKYYEDDYNDENVLEVDNDGWAVNRDGSKLIYIGKNTKEN